MKTFGELFFSVFKLTKQLIILVSNFEVQLVYNNTHDLIIFLIKHTLDFDPHPHFYHQMPIIIIKEWKCTHLCNFTLPCKQFICTHMELVMACTLLATKNSHKVIRWSSGVVSDMDTHVSLWHHVIDHHNVHRLVLGLVSHSQNLCTGH